MNYRPYFDPPFLILSLLVMTTSKFRHFVPDLGGQVEGGAGGGGWGAVVALECLVKIPLT